MRFQGENSPKGGDLNTSRSSKRLVPIAGAVNPEVRMHFKALEEMGNDLASMRQKESDRIGLINKLQTVFGGGDINLERTSLDVLLSCKLNRSKTLKTMKSVRSSSLRTEVSGGDGNKYN